MVQFTTREGTPRFRFLYHCLKVAHWVIYVFSNPNDSSSAIAQYVAKQKYEWLIFIDRDQKLLKYLGATVSSEVFLLDSSMVLRYQGRIDDNIFSSSSVKKKDLEIAIESVVSHTVVENPITLAAGCKIPLRHN